MARILASPGKYIQGKGVLKDLGKYVNDFGERILGIIDPVVKELYAEELQSGLAGKELIMETFGGESSKKEIERLAEIARQNNIELIMGAGGGKTIDTAKAVAYYTKTPVMIIPTIAATDAPCSALSVIYTEEGVFEEYLFLPRNPDIVVVDTEIIARAPVRYLVSGMGDALATYFEASACAKTKVQSIAGGSQTMTALSLARLCYDTLLKYGHAAKKAAEASVVTEALEKIIEANTLLSGLGFESGGLAAAHAVHNGFTALEETHDRTHGEKVAYSTLVQMVLEDRDPEEIEKVFAFCKGLGLPTTLSELGVKEIKEEDIMKVAWASCAEDDTMHNMPFEITPEMVKDAIIAVDRLGR
ncbi:MAG: glycerol dehydrogenase [Halanaerobiaceae bacterium]|nr:glycerol dehydrogenase [Halanaerobiaceae bacterium]